MAFDFGSLLGGIVPGVEKGVERGLQYSADFARMLVFAVGHDKPDEVATLKAIAMQWLSEAADEAGVIRGDVVKTIEGGGDPFQKSRAMMQAAEAKYGKP